MESNRSNLSLLLFSKHLLNTLIWVNYNKMNSAGDRKPTDSDPEGAGQSRSIEVIWGPPPQAVFVITMKCVVWLLCLNE